MLHLSSLFLKKTKTFFPEADISSVILQKIVVTWLFPFRFKAKMQYNVV